MKVITNKNTQEKIVTDDARMIRTAEKNPSVYEIAQADSPKAKKAEKEALELAKQQRFDAISALTIEDLKAELDSRSLDYSKAKKHGDFVNLLFEADYPKDDA